MVKASPHKRNEEKRQEQIACFQQVWTAGEIFGRLGNDDIKWNLTPPSTFLPQELGAWLAPPISILRRSPSPDSEADFVAQPDFATRVQDFLDEIGRNVPLPPRTISQETPHQSPGSQTQGGDEMPQDQQASSHRTTSTANSTQLTPNPAQHVSREVPPATELPSLQQATRSREPLSTLDANQGSRASFVPHPHTRPPPSRPKLRCKFGPRAGRSGENVNPQQNTQAADLGNDTSEIDDLLREIDVVRLQKGENDHPTRTFPEANTLTRDTPRPKSRPKVKCRFGPNTKSSYLPLRRLTTPEHDDHYATPRNNLGTPSPIASPLPSTLPEEDPRDEAPLNFPPPAEALGCLDGTRPLTRIPPLQPSTSSISQADQGWQPPDALWLRADEGAPLYPEDELALNPEIPARVTLTAPAGPYRTPLDKYKASAEEAPRLNPKRFLLRKLGLSEEEFDARTAAEVDELLRAYQIECRLDSLAASSSEAPRVLTKEDAWFFFNATGIPTSPALLGAYWWAADFGNTRFNFEMELTPENIELLNAYD